MNGRRVRCFKNAEEIAEYIGENGRQIGRLVLEEDLPAWKRSGGGAWRAIDLDLDGWMLRQSRKYRPSARKDAEKDSQ